VQTFDIPDVKMCYKKVLPLSGSTLCG